VLFTTLEIEKSLLQENHKFNPGDPSPEEKIENKPILFSNLRREELDI
jgi:hypothetical protein